MSLRDPRRAEETLTESTRNLVLGAVIAVVLVGSVIAAFVVDGGDSDGGLGLAPTTTAQTAPPATTSSTTTPEGAAPGGGNGTGNGNGMTSDGTGDMTGPRVIAETGAESLLTPGGLLLAAAILLRRRGTRSRP